MTRLYFVSSDTSTMVSVRRVVRHLIRITILAEHQIMLHLCIGFAERRRAEKQEHRQRKPQYPFFHAVLRLWGKIF